MTNDFSFLWSAGREAHLIDPFSLPSFKVDRGGKNTIKRWNERWQRFTQVIVKKAFFSIFVLI